MKLITFFLISMFSFQAFSGIVLEPLLPEEVHFVTALAKKYDLVEEMNCKKARLDVVSRVRGFNPASWTLTSGNKTVVLKSKEIASMIDLVDRLAVPLTPVDSITMETRVSLLGSTCGSNSGAWLATFDDQSGLE